MPRRILAIWLRQLALDRWRQKESTAKRQQSPLPDGEGPGEGAPRHFSRHTPSRPPPQGGGDFDASPFALIGETAHGPRIEAANAAALANGVRANMLLADARGMCPPLATHPSDPAGDLAFLERFAVWAQRWGPWSAVDPPDGVLVDCSAVAHLFGGEQAMLAEAQALVERQGLAVRLAIAPTAGAAWGLAHYGPERAILYSDVSPRESGDLVPSGDRPPPARGLTQNAIPAALSSLPVAALRLDPDVLLVLRRLGLKRIGDIAEIGRDALQRRFRTRRAPAANPLVRLDQLLGRVPEPLLPVLALEAPLVQRRLLEPIRHRPLLDRVLADLAEDMARLLEGRGEGARRLELGLWRVDGEAAIRRLELAAAARDPRHIARLFAARLDDVDAGFGIELVRLAAPWCEKLALSQEDFEAAADRHGTSLAACIDRLSVRLGPEAVRRPVPFASHLPERAQAWGPPLEQASAEGEETIFHARPLKLLDRAEAIAVLYASPDGFPRRFRWRGQVHEVARVEGPERIAPEWWRERSSVRLRDYYRIEDGEGRRYWIYRHGIIGDGRGNDKSGGAPEWFLQGLFA